MHPVHILYLFAVDDGRFYLSFCDSLQSVQLCLAETCQLTSTRYHLSVSVYVQPTLFLFIFWKPTGKLSEKLLCLPMSVICYNQGHRFSTANFAKFCGAICDIPRHYYPQILWIPRPDGVVVLTDNTSKCKEFILTCNTKSHYIRPLMIKISS